MRTFVIINDHKEQNIFDDIIFRLPKDSRKIIFAFFDIINLPEGVETVKFDEELINHPAKLKNFVSKWLFDNNVKGFVHIIEDSVKIDNDPNVFLNEIEKMMLKLGQKTWYNTSCDQCNYVFSKYNPRMSVELDEENLKKIYDKKINWCSNANTFWVCYNYDICTFDDVELDERFDIAMYYIIKFLANRRNNKQKGELYYMNFYPSIPEEIGVFSTKKIENNFEVSREQMKNEDNMFKEMNINTSPNMVLEEVLDDLNNYLTR